MERTRAPGRKEYIDVVSVDSVSIEDGRVAFIGRNPHTACRPQSTQSMQGKSKFERDVVYAGRRPVDLQRKVRRPGSRVVIEARAQWIGAIVARSKLCNRRHA